MQILNKIFLLIDKNTQKEIFSSDKHLKDNLNALRQLRNAVMHNHILITQNLGDVWLNDKNINTIQAHIENAILLAPTLAKNNLKITINNCLIIDENKPHTSENEYKISDKYKTCFEVKNE